MHVRGRLTRGTPLVPKMPLSTAMQRPTMTASVTVSMMAAASPATRARRTGALYRLQNRNSSPAETQPVVTDHRSYTDHTDHTDHIQTNPGHQGKENRGLVQTPEQKQLPCRVTAGRHRPPAAPAHIHTYTDHTDHTQTIHRPHTDHTQTNPGHQGKENRGLVQTPEQKQLPCRDTAGRHRPQIIYRPHTDHTQTTHRPHTDQPRPPGQGEQGPCTDSRTETAPLLEQTQLTRVMS